MIDRPSSYVPDFLLSRSVGCFCIYRPPPSKVKMLVTSISGMLKYNALPVNGPQSRNICQVFRSSDNRTTDIYTAENFQQTQSSQQHIPNDIYIFLLTRKTPFSRVA